MKTLFALLSGAALGTAAALWLAARNLRQQPAAGELPAVPADQLEAPAPEEASA